MTDTTREQEIEALLHLPQGDGASRVELYDATRWLLAELRRVRELYEAEHAMRLEDLEDQQKEWDRANVAEERVQALEGALEECVTAYQAADSQRSYNAILAARALVLAARGGPRAAKETT